MNRILFTVLIYVFSLSFIYAEDDNIKKRQNAMQQVRESVKVLFPISKVLKNKNLEIFPLLFIPFIILLYKTSYNLGTAVINVGRASIRLLDILSELSQYQT